MNRAKIDEHIKGRIRLIREINCLTQEQVADGIGIDRREYAQIEKGARYAKAWHIIALANYYGCSADLLLGTCTGEFDLNTLIATSEAKVAKWIGKDLETIRECVVRISDALVKGEHHD